MRKIDLLPLVLLFVVSVPHSSYAQDPKPEPDAKAMAEDLRYYHLDFAVREIGEDGKILNSRAYSLIVGPSEQHHTQSSIRTGSKVMVPAGANMMQNLDVGVNIDCRDVRLVQKDLYMHVNAEVSSVADATKETTGVIRQNKWESDVTLPVGKPTVLFSSDNVATKGKLQLELTAIPIR